MSFAGMARGLGWIAHDYAVRLYVRGQLFVLSLLERVRGNVDTTTAPSSFAGPGDDMEPLFPVELLLEAVPVSQQAKGSSKEAWKLEVRQAVERVLDPAGWASSRPVSVTIFYFPDGLMQGDVDNIVKPILDALAPRIYLDDAQVQRVVVQKFESERSFQFENPSTALAEALDTERPVIYIRVDSEDSARNWMPW